MASWIKPQNRVNTMAMVGSFSTVDAANVFVSRDMMAVGPSVMSLAVPINMYTKQPINAEYRPYCKQNGEEMLWSKRRLFQSDTDKRAFIQSSHTSSKMPKI